MSRWWAILPGLMLAVLCGAAAHAAVSVTDDRGVTVQWPSPPQRIISLLPSLTETVCELGACDRLVAVDRYTNHPASVRTLPHLGGLDDVDIERTVALRPDVVLLARSSRAIDRLEALGIPVLALEPTGLQGVASAADRVSRMLGRPEAGVRLWQALQARIDQAAQRVPAQARGWRVYVEVDSSPYAAGEASFIGGLLTRLGLGNIVPAAMGPFPKLNPEHVVRADPDLIMVSQGQADALAQRPGWARLRAVRERRICAMTPAQMDVLTRPGPRLGEAAMLMADCVRGAVR